MPRRSRGRGFKHTKAGRFHAERGGGGRGTRGRKKSSSDVLVGESSDEYFSPSSVSSVDDAESVVDSEESNSSSAFMRALSPLGDSNCSYDMRSSPDVGSTGSTMFSDALKLLISVVPKHWTVIQGQKGFHVLCLSKSCENISIQREVFAEFSGIVKVFVHRKEVLSSLFDEFVKEVSEVVPLTDLSLRLFVDKVLHVVLAVRSYEICAGADSLKFQDLWSDDTSGDIDLNPYDESRYSVTFRSHSCALLVPIQSWKCSECSKAVDRLRVRSKSHGSEEAHPNTRNTYLDEKQKMQKLQSQRKQIKNAKRKIDYLSSRVSALIAQEGITLDKDVGEDLTNILRESKLTPIQQLFIQQQFKSSMCKNARGMRWHATMIRFALLIKSTSTAAFGAIQSSGVIRLPSDRTLFDYSNAIPRSEGVFKEKLDVIGKKVSDYKDEHQHYHSLLMDEIHISQKLVYRKSDASLVGYVKLNEVETEMQTLVDSINNGVVQSEPTMASKVLAYMVKGCTNSVKEVVAAFSTASLTKEQLFDKSWSVISSCEKVGVKVLALVCDGSSVNRSFIGMHTPATPSSKGVVFDSVNLCAPDRNIFFFRIHLTYSKQ